MMVVAAVGHVEQCFAIIAATMHRCDMLDTQPLHTLYKHMQGYVVFSAQMKAAERIIHRNQSTQVTPALIG